ncbi:hypothetical protein GCM10027570_16050 [Streptomonospora sediminis]
MRRRNADRPARGTHDRPYSALNLRLVLASLGIVISLALGAVAWAADLPVAAAILWVLAAVGAVDLVVVLRRRRQRGPGHRSLFE